MGHGKKDKETHAGFETDKCKHCNKGIQQKKVQQRRNHLIACDKAPGAVRVAAIETELNNLRAKIDSLNKHREGLRSGLHTKNLQSDDFYPSPTSSFESLAGQTLTMEPAQLMIAGPVAGTFPPPTTPPALTYMGSPTSGDFPQFPPHHRSYPGPTPSFGSDLQTSTAYMASPTSGNFPQFPPHDRSYPGLAPSFGSDLQTSTIEQLQLINDIGGLAACGSAEGLAQLPEEFLPQWLAQGGDALDPRGR